MAFRVRLTVLWVLSWLIPVGVQSTLSLKLGSSGVFESASFAFWMVVIAATTCVLVAAALIRRAFKTNTAELGFLGLFYMAVSVLPLVHGITTPGVIYGENSATMASSMWAIPTAIIVASPMFGNRHGALMARWRVWVIVALGFLGGLSALFLTRPDAIPAFTPRSIPAIGVAALSIAGCIVLSHRHFQLAQIAHKTSPLAVSAGYGLVAASAAMWLGSIPYSIGFWAAHAFDIVGVLTGLVAATVVYQKSESVRTVLAPIVAIEPIAALEVGLEPVVHHFVADLQAKDPTTRDHVVRTAELTISVAQELGMNPTVTRRVGLAGLLHDVGKLEIPYEILTKPDRLTESEYEVIKGHSAAGEAMVAKTSTIADIGPAIRSHHERVDGTGYPDGLRGDEVCLEARIVSVCDAYDAMVNTRQYRQGMERAKAVAILREHSGSQWDSQVVAALIRVVADWPIGQRKLLVANETPIGCDCFPAEADGLMSSQR